MGIFFSTRHVLHTSEIAHIVKRLLPLLLKWNSNICSRLGGLECKINSTYPNHGGASMTNIKQTPGRNDTCTEKKNSK